jgi:hypothetical protein
MFPRDFKKVGMRATAVPIPVLLASSRQQAGGRGLEIMEFKQSLVIFHFIKQVNAYLLTSLNPRQCFLDLMNLI